LFNYTNGHPLKIDMLIGSLFASSTSSYLQVNPSTGQLSTNSFMTLSDSVEAISRTGSALVQFDRLEKQFQDFLRKASLFGQYFNVSDINEVFDTEYGHDADIKSWIEKADQYRFLSVHEGDDNGDSLFFKHITVQTAIYESLSYEQREQWHLKIATSLEKKLRYASANSDSSIAVIGHHYSKTSEIEKNVYYLERLGYSTLKKCFYRESQNALERLIDFVEHCQIPANTSPIARAAISDPVVPLCLKALSLVGINYPVSDKKIMKKATLKSMIRLWVNWRKTKGGRRLSRVNGKEVQYFGVGEIGHNIGEGCSTTCVNCPKIRRVTSTCLRSLYQAGSVQSSLSRSAMGLVLFELLNADIGTAPVDNGEFITSLYRASFVLELLIPRLSDIYLKAGVKLESERDLGDKTHNVYYAMSYNKIGRGDVAGGCDLIKASITYFQNRDDKSNAYAARVVLAACPIWLGNLQEVLDILNGQWDNTWFKINPVWTNVSLFVAARVHYLRGDFTSLRQILELQAFYTESLPKNGSFKGYDTMLYLSTAWCRLLEQESLAALQTFEQMVDAFAKVQLAVFGASFRGRDETLKTRLRANLKITMKAKVVANVLARTCLSESVSNHRTPRLHKIVNVWNTPKDDDRAPPALGTNNTGRNSDQETSEDTLGYR
ncbi:hypothetical protein HDV05_007354, partial [Chytridiales sp. JEL 0842]